VKGERGGGGEGEGVHTYGLLFGGHLRPALSDGLGDGGNALSFLSELNHDLGSHLLDEEHPSVEVLLGCVGVLLLLLLGGRSIIVRLGVLSHLAFVALLVLSSTLLIRLHT